MIVNPFSLNTLFQKLKNTEVFPEKVKDNCTDATKLNKYAHRTEVLPMVCICGIQFI